MNRDLETLVARRAALKGILAPSHAGGVERGELSLESLVERDLLSRSSLEVLLSEISGEIVPVRTGASGPGEGIAFPEPDRAHPSNAPTQEMPAGAEPSSVQPRRGSSQSQRSSPSQGLAPELPPAEWGRYDGAEFIAVDKRAIHA